MRTIPFPRLLLPFLLLASLCATDAAATRGTEDGVVQLEASRCVAGSGSGRRR